MGVTELLWTTREQVLFEVVCPQQREMKVVGNITVTVKPVIENIAT